MKSVNLLLLAGSSSIALATVTVSTRSRTLQAELPPDVQPTMISTTSPVTGMPTMKPTVAPTEAPTVTPTAAPTGAPTRAPTTKKPTTRKPTRKPTTRKPTSAPTRSPTAAPTLTPTTAEPTFAPTTATPSLSPTTAEPTLAPTTAAPTLSPTTATPSLSPTTAEPTLAPTTAEPTLTPTTAEPTLAPTTAEPTLTPTTAEPTLAPTTAAPSLVPVTNEPTPNPTASLATLSPTGVPLLTCPSTDGSFNFTSAGPVVVSITEADSLCTLVQVSDDGLSFKPLGRSYNGYDWEASSGEFSKLLWSCSGPSCQTNLPPLPTGSVYQLTTFEMFESNLTTSDKVARFLEQATFGATRADIQGIDSSNLPRSFASWIENQQMTIPMTSHRAMFRMHMNERMEVATQQGAVTHPCQKGTRYRRSSFSYRDQRKIMNITTVGTKKVITVDGFVRTVVEGPIAWSSKTSSKVWSDGSYEIISGSQNANFLGAKFQLRHPTGGITSYDVTFNGTYGNPRIGFDPAVNATPNVLVTLTSDYVQPIDEKYFATQNVKVQELILTQTLSDGVCDTLGEPGNPIDPVFAFYDGEYWIHDPRFDTFSNTVESPTPDGGGKVVRETFNVVQSDRGAVCANAPRTFLNEENCKFSDATTACSAGSFDPFALLRTQLSVPMSHQTMRDIYSITGGGVEGTRYVYAVDGLRFQGDTTAAFPCQVNAKSRWIPMPTSCPNANASVDSVVHSIFSKLLFDTIDSNALVRDVKNNSTIACPTPASQVVGFEVQDLGGKCWKNVHPDHLNVYDFAYWTQLGTHPGNSIYRNPIKEFAEAGNTTLRFPSWHGMDRWTTYKTKFGFVGRLGDNISYYSLPRELRTSDLNEYYGFTPETFDFPISTGAMVCGSPFEVANDASLGGSMRQGAFGSLNWDFHIPDQGDFAQQKGMIWIDAALSAQDQLRQRTAWALAQILVISPDSIDDGFYDTEATTAYYDIFLRNAFGNYRDVLKEVSYSPLMAEMLTYLGSKSIGYTWRRYQNVEYPDENFAREIMQLFSIGLAKLNLDGTHVVDETGETMRVYTNDDIVEYARVWTGFETQGLRGNIEDLKEGNRVDPLQIKMDYRDMFPKMGLDRKYIGDGVPLCRDRPNKHFLKTGATYRLLGRTSTPELQTDPREWASDPLAVRLKLEPNGGPSLFQKLCGSQNPASCNFSAKIILDENVPCSGKECAIDTVRVVEIAVGLFYEYVPRPCVYEAFFGNPKTVVRQTSYQDVTCADPRTQVASAACCIRLSTGVWVGNWTDVYWGERVTFDSAYQRCNPNFCSRTRRPSCSSTSVGNNCKSNHHFWTSSPCTLRAKIDSTGNVAIVYAPTGVEEAGISKQVQSDTKTFFRVDWSGDVAAVVANCTAISSCRLAVDGECLCDVSVEDQQVFFGEGVPSRSDVLAQLHIGAFDPAASDVNFIYRNSANVTMITANGTLTSESIFEVIDDNGIRQFRKNVRSTVRVANLDVSFRNPVHFIHTANGALHEAQAETDAALDHYFYHQNTAPFLALRFAQRFGISNPSPGFISRISTAFRKGSYIFNTGMETFEYGSGKYGDIGATVACILLDRETRTTILDADPVHGALKEPLMKVIGLMRTLEFQPANDAGFIEFDSGIKNTIGQMAHAIPNVFSFFLPEHKPPGPVAQAALVSPEAQIITGPTTINFANGILSLIKYGLTHCLGGFGRPRNGVTVLCQKFVAGANNHAVAGKLTYTPSNTASAESIVNELATLLTSGRLSQDSRDIIKQAIQSESNQTQAVLKAEQLIALAPEFHSTNIVRKSGASRPEPEPKATSLKPYKAVVYVLLSGGMDSFNMLVPHRCSTKNAANQTLLEQYYAERTNVAITSSERSRVINVTGQGCDQFVIHEDLPIVEKLYKDGDLAFFANAGVLNRPSDKMNYYDQSRTILFSHNTMQEEIQKVDPFDGAIGTGVLGRMCDILQKKTFSVQPITVQDASVATIGVPGSGIDPLTVSPYGTNSFNPKADGETFNPRPYLDMMNDATKLQSSIYGETWSRRFEQGLNDNQAILQALATANLTAVFPANRYGDRLKSVATLIGSQNQRGKDREVFYVNLDGWDHHEQMKSSVSGRFKDLSSSLTAFQNEMKAQGRWDQVSLVITSDFGRTLTCNSGNGTDHGWGGNYFVMGGAVNGGKIHGEYPLDITDASPLSLGRGRFLPTLSWESILNPIAQWMGVETAQDLDFCLPNRNQTGTQLFQKEDIFVI